MPLSTGLVEFFLAVQRTLTYECHDRCSYGAYYGKVAKKVQEKGDDFVKAEFERLQRMIISGSLRTEKEGEFKLRCNVLKVL